MRGVAEDAVKDIYEHIKQVRWDHFEFFFLVNFLYALKSRFSSWTDT